MCKAVAVVFDFFYLFLLCLQHSPTPLLSNVSFYGLVKLALTLIDIAFIVSLRIDSCLALWLTLREIVFIVFNNEDLNFWLVFSFPLQNKDIDANVLSSVVTG